MYTGERVDRDDAAAPKGECGIAIHDLSLIPVECQSLRATVIAANHSAASSRRHV